MKKTTRIQFNNRKPKAGLLFSSVVFLLLLLGPASYKLYTQSILDVYASVESLATLSTVV